MVGKTVVDEGSADYYKEREKGIALTTDVHSISQENLEGKFDRSVSLLCWAYNEEDSIKEYLEKATQLMDATTKRFDIVQKAIVFV